MKLVLVFLIVSIPAYSADNCILTDAYKTARAEMNSQANSLSEPFNECRHSMQAAYHWKAVAKCVKDGAGKNIGGGCSHLVVHGPEHYRREKIDISHSLLSQLTLFTNAK